MSHDNASDPDYRQAEEEALTREVSDEALEVTSNISGRAGPTLFHATYCFGCPA